MAGAGAEVAAQVAVTADRDLHQRGGIGRSRQIRGGQGALSQRTGHHLHHLNQGSAAQLQKRAGLEKEAALKEEREHNHSPRSPVEKSRSPVSCDKGSPVARRYRGPSDTNGQGRSQSPWDQRSSPVDEANNSQNTSPRGSQSP